MRKRSRVQVFCCGAVLVAALLGASPAGAAVASVYPSWADVQAAKASVGETAAAVDQVVSLIGQLEANVVVTRAEAELSTDQLILAQQKLDEASRRTRLLAAQAEAATVEAQAAQRQAGQVAAQLHRTGTGDVGLDLFLGTGQPAATDALLGRLGHAERMIERTSQLHDQATTAQNTARSLSDQTALARTERENLRLAAEDALTVAQAAQAAAETALSESELKKIELDQQLLFLQDTEARTAAAYQEGERIRKEEEERRRQEAAAGGGGGGSGEVEATGWAKPAAGRVTDWYGERPVICGGDGCSSGYHYAIDLGTGCSAPIYAASAGVISYAGWSGTYGNFIKMDHGGGISTGYAHIRPDGIFVGAGQHVSAGQNIASSGTTGASTGCHLHFEVYRGNTRINPVPFMADRGIHFG